jgi:hypothetical protein
MKIEYTMKEVRPNIFAVIVPNQYDRAMLFCRAQEFYESDSDLFKEQDFSIWEYMKWYSAKNKGVFTYTKDWSGFNIPFKKLVNCYVVKHLDSPYDRIMEEIINKILAMKHIDLLNAYVIGTESDKGQTFKHELCHALYYTNREYKILADVVSWLHPSKDTYNTLSSNLKKLGYNDDVIPDEIQAYMMTNYKSKYFSKGVDIGILNELHKKYKEQLNRFLK